LVRYSFDSDGSDCSADSDDGNDDFAVETIQWSQSDFGKILETFKLPKRFTQMIARCHCSFTQFLLAEADGKEKGYGKPETLLNVNC
jgi:hypothetical protein